MVLVGFYFVVVQHLFTDGSHSAGFLNDLGVSIEDITFFEGKALKAIKLCY